MYICLCENPNGFQGTLAIPKRSFFMSQNGQNVIHVLVLFSFFVFPTLSSSKFEKRTSTWITNFDFFSHKIKRRIFPLWASCSERFFHCLTNLFSFFQNWTFYFCPKNKKGIQCLQQKIDFSVVSIMLRNCFWDFQFVTEHFFMNRNCG